MRVTSISLSDGRELRYYDADGTALREAIDCRGLGEGTTEQGRIRLDPLTGEWVSIAGHRQSRIFLPATTDCPLCPSSPGNPSEIPESDYQVVVFENRFPSFMSTSVVPDTDAAPDWGLDAPAHGRCEVVAFSSDHGGSIGTLNADHMGLVLSAWQDRTDELATQDGIRYVFVFENRGAEVGVTLHHPHGQIYAYPYVPPAARQVLDQAAIHHHRTGRRLLDDIVAFESDAGERVVYQDENWIAFVPYAARWPFELQIHPRRPHRLLTQLSEVDHRTFCDFYPRLIRSLDGIFGSPFPYMSGWHQEPAHPTELEMRDSRLFMRLISNRRAADKLKFLAGSEALMGAFINDVTPEDAARRLRTAFEESE